MLDAALRLRRRMRVPLLTVLTYHHVAEPAADYAFDPAVADASRAQFRRQCEVLARRFSVIGIDQLCDALDGAPLPPNPALITFDDGYRSCLEVAAPILDDLGLRAVFFIPTGYVDERRLFWWERIAWLIGRAGRAGVGRFELAYPSARTVDPADPAATVALLRVVKDTRGLDVDRFLDELTAGCRVDWSRDLERELTDGLLMTWEQIRQLRDAGMDIGSHTRRHRVLQTLGPAELDDELAGSRADLARELGAPPRSVAYPVGRALDDSPHIREAVVRAGYQIGFNNVGGATWLGRAADRFDLGRQAMERDLSDDLFVGVLAIPLLRYQAKAPTGYGTV